MKRLMISIIFIFAALFFAAPNAQSADTKKTKNPAILISFDGAQPGVIEQMLQSGKLSKDGGFAKLISDGTQAQGMTSVLPTVTATNHVTIATGAYPDRTNIPANTFHLVDTGLTTTTSGFGTAIEAETLWEAAKRQGKKVVTIAFAGADARGAARRGDQTLGFGVRDGFSAVKNMNASHFDSGAAAAWNLDGQACEFKKTNLGTIPANQVFFQTFSLGRVDVNVLVCDTIENGQEQYDTAFFDFDKDLSNGVIAKMKAGEWAPFALTSLNVPPDPTFPDFARGTVGAWVKLTAFTANLSAFNLYSGDISHNVGYPQAFVSEIDKSLGFWPAEPDFFNLEGGRIEEATYMEQLERLAIYLKDAMLLAIEKYEPDLLMGYQVQTDEAGHQFFLVDPRQQGYSDTAKRQRYAAYIEKSYQIADANLKEIIDAAGLHDTNIIAVSDHGMSPLHTQGFPNRILRAAGLVSVTGTGAVDPLTSRTNAVTVGGAANVYINLQGREPTGIVPLEQYESLQDEIVKVFAAVNDLVTKEPVFQIILKKPHAEDILKKTSNFNANGSSKNQKHDFHVFGGDTGDVLIVARPGYNFDFNARTGSAVGNFFQSSTFFGQHGYDPTLPEMKAIFYAAGPDFKAKKLKEIDNIDVAPTVADLLGIEPPADAQGKTLNSSTK